jgi:hypothetical protein
MMLALINKLSLRIVKKTNPASSNVFISDESGAGKDHIVRQVCKLLIPKERYEHVSDISEKLLNYWTIPEKDGGTFDGFVMHLEDPAPERIMSQAFKIRASGENKVRFVKDGKPVVTQVVGKPVIVVTSLQATIDVEGMRRWDSLRVDTTAKVTERMIELYADVEAGLSNTKYDNDLIHALHYGLRRKGVRIPYAPAISKLLPNRLIIRTQVQKLFDYIKASAALHQYQRETDKETGEIIANLFDYDYACFCFILLGDIYGMSLNKREKEILETLATAPDYGLSISELADRVTLSKTSLYGKGNSNGYMDNMKEKGLITQFTQYNAETKHHETRYVIKENIAMAFNLPTSPQLIKIMQDNSVPKYSKLFHRILDELPEEMKNPTTFHFFEHIKAINEERKKQGFRALAYSEEGGMNIHLLDFIQEKVVQEKIEG